MRTFTLTFVIFCVWQLSSSSHAFSYQKQNTANDQLFENLDQNGDGTLDPYEAFDRLLEIESQIKPKPLSQKSLTALIKRQNREEREEIKELLSEFDQNDDGKTSLKEMADFAEMDFSQIDVNKDGFISVEEAMKIRFEEDQLSPEEIQQEVKQIFRQLDQNRNQFLTKNETNEDFPWDLVAQSDQNKDQRISKKELTAFFESEHQPATFHIQKGKAVMTGVIGPTTPQQVLKLIFQHPEVKTIVMGNVPGSMDDESNLRAAALIRKFGFTTIVPKDGVIASGGTDFFLAGKKRFVETGAKLGIHSWGGPGFQGKDLPKDHPQHQMYLDYYDTMGIPQAFYWRTLEAAPAEGVHWMTEKELRQFRFRTTPQKKKTVPPKNTSPSNQIAKRDQKIELTGEAKMMLTLLDLNNNQQLEASELEGDAKEMLRELDKDKNGTISKRELKSLSGPQIDIHSKLAKIDTHQNDKRIVSLPKNLYPGLNKHFKKYTNVLAPNGKPIHLIAMNKWSDDRILRVRKVLEHFLRDVPDIPWGKKTELANAMGDNHATMVLLNNSGDMDRVMPALEDLNLQLQDLRANESPYEGEKDYMGHKTRDAAFEEAFHLIHGSGIIHVMKPYDREIRELAKQAASKKIWNYDEPNMPGNHFEYIICVYDNYLDLWKTPPTLMEGRSIPWQPKGKSFNGEYHADRRSNISSVDPKGLKMIEKFHPKKIGYTAELPKELNDTFSINENGKSRYGEKAKHLLNVTLRGDKNSTLIGNSQDNRLVGNRGNNRLQGNGGDDSLFGGPGNDVAIFRGKRSQYTLIRVGGFLEVHDSMVNRDGYDVLSGIEKIKFSDSTVNVKDIR